MKNKQIAAGWIIFWMILFWPVGVYLLIKRINSGKSSIPKKSKNMGIWSWILILLGLISITGAITDGDVRTLLLSVIIFIIPGVILNKTSRKMQNTVEFKEEYINEAVKETVDSIKEMVGKNSKDTLIEKATKVCSACGASIFGPKGQVIVCDYCTTHQQL